jgi:hypothetical protein
LLQKPKCQGSFNGIKLRNNTRAAPCLKESPVVSGFNGDNILDKAAWHEKLAAIGRGMAHIFQEDYNEMILKLFLELQ